VRASGLSHLIFFLLEVGVVAQDALFGSSPFAVASWHSLLGTAMRLVSQFFLVHDIFGLLRLTFLLLHRLRTSLDLLRLFRLFLHFLFLFHYFSDLFELLGREECGLFVLNSGIFGLLWFFEYFLL
jgi:hypothetical protein